MVVCSLMVNVSFEVQNLVVHTSHSRSNTLYGSVVMLLDFINKVTASSKMKPF